MREKKRLRVFVNPLELDDILFNNILARLDTSNLKQCILVDKRWSRLTWKVFSPSSVEVMHYCENGYTNTVKRIITEKKMNIESCFMGFICACTGGYIEIVDFFLGHKNFDPLTKWNDNPIIETTLCPENIKTGRNRDVIKSLLKDGRVDPSVHDNITLRTWVNIGDEEVVRLLMKNEKVSPVSWVGINEERLVLWLSDANLTYRYAERWRNKGVYDALTIACVKGISNILKILLESPKINTRALARTFTIWTYCILWSMTNKKSRMKNEDKKRYREMLRILKSHQEMRDVPAGSIAKELCDVFKEKSLSHPIELQHEPGKGSTATESSNMLKESDTSFISDFYNFFLCAYAGEDDDKDNNDKVRQ